MRIRRTRWRSRRAQRLQFACERPADSLRNGTCALTIGVWASSPTSGTIGGARRDRGRTSTQITAEVLEADPVGRDLRPGPKQSPGEEAVRQRYPRSRRQSPEEECPQKKRATHSNSRRGLRSGHHPDEDIRRGRGRPRVGDRRARLRRSGQRAPSPAATIRRPRTGRPRIGPPVHGQNGGSSTTASSATSRSVGD